VKRRRLLPIAILLLAGTPALKSAGPEATWIGVLWTKGPVSVGDAKVSSGTTVLPRDVITTAEGASAWIRFRSPASAIMLADTRVAVLGSNPLPSLLLQRGTLVLDEKVADPVQITLPGGFVLVQGDPQSGAECEMAAAGNAATVSVKRGVSEVHSQGAPVILHPGQSTRLNAGQSSAQPVAGKIGKEIPEATTQHEGQTQEVPLVLNEVINWNDVVRTAQAAKALITLIDGSSLGVGLRSTVKVVKHDPQAQQTEIELTSGRVQASVQKITSPGGKFEVRTKNAVIGTNEGSFVVVADEKGTRACGVDGVTEVKSADPNVSKQERLRRNMCAYLVLGGPPSEPVLSPSEVASILNDTVIETGGHALPLKTVAEVAAAGGAAIAIAGIVLATSGTTSPTTP